MDESKTMYECEYENLAHTMGIIKKCYTLPKEDLNGKYKKAFWGKINEARGSVAKVMFLGITEFCYFAPNEVGEELRDIASSKILAIADELNKACITGNMKFVDQKIAEIRTDFWNNVYLSDIKYMTYVEPATVNS